MNAASIERYIKLITKDKLEKQDIKNWYHCVVKHSPPGVTKSITVTDDKGKPTSVYLVHRVTDDTHNYLVPLTRDLSDEEIDEIVKSFAKDKPDLDFSVETNETRLRVKDFAGIALDADRHLALCNALEKQKHEDWVRERSASGWRYGTEFNSEEKTHPLILPWDQLPDKFKQPDMSWPQKLVSLLNSQGYAIIKQSELNDLITSLGYKNLRENMGDYGAENVESRRKSMRGKSLPEVGYKDSFVRIYRATNADSFLPMDYVTRSKRFANEHADHMAATEIEDHKVITAYVKASLVYEAPNPGEYFYDGPPLKGRVSYVANAD